MHPFLIGVLLWTGLFPARAAVTWQVRHVDLQMAIDPAAKQIQGVARLSLSARQSAGPLVLDLSDSLTVDSARVTGTRGSMRGIREPGRVRFALPGGPAANYVAEVWYHGQPARRAVGFAGHGPAYRIASYGVPRSAREWWPIIDEPEQKADSADIWITAPTALTAVSIGRMVARVATDDGKGAVTHWATRYPIYPDAISFALGDYAVTRTTATISGDRRLPIDFYLFPEDSAKGASDFAHVEDILAFYAGALGPYPYAREKYALVEFARPSFREAQTLSHIGAALITGNHGNEQVFAHEIAHQWFGNSLTVRRWEDIWLNESLSEYMAWQWIRRTQGETAYQALIDSALVAKVNAPIVPANPADFNTLFGNATFQRGPAVLVMLERMIGTAHFDAALRTYVAHHAHGIVTTIDFQRACEKEYGQSLDAFFAQWVRGWVKLELSR